MKVIAAFTRSCWTDFLRDVRGTIIVISALALPVLIMAGGIAVDFVIASNQKTRLQAAIDAAAMAAAKEMSLSDPSNVDVASVVEAIAGKLLDGDNSSRKWAAAPRIQTVVRQDTLEVAVHAQQRVHAYFAQGFGGPFEDISVSATARIVGNPNICLLALEQSKSGAVELLQQARLTGQNCAVFSNSSHTNAIKSKNSASLKASLICSHGGKDGGPGNFTPEPLTDCPAFDDPLASRPEPSFSACLATDKVISGGSQILSPGRYCGGLTINAGADVQFQPGVYVIDSGPLEVSGGAKVKGENVGFFLRGPDALINFTKDSSISLTAPKDGLLAGLLFFESRSAPASGQHRILSNDARMLLGTIYLAPSDLYVAADAPVADQSAYTAVVVKRLLLDAGPHLVLNSDYGLTDVPVPAGVRGTGQPIALVK